MGSETLAALEMRTKPMHAFVPHFMAFIKYLWLHPLKSDCHKSSSAWKKYKQSWNYNLCKERIHKVKTIYKKRVHLYLHQHCNVQPQSVTYRKWQNQSSAKPGSVRDERIQGECVWLQQTAINVSPCTQVSNSFHFCSYSISSALVENDLNIAQTH